DIINVKEHRRQKSTAAPKPQRNHRPISNQFRLPASPLRNVSVSVKRYLRIQQTNSKRKNAKNR
ncbi:hypothetical protein QCN27_13870, partial [Cereibacter sp. SYSU M97828]|nr:hypothetical protein [Cereibacter flavus]